MSSTIRIPGESARLANIKYEICHLPLIITMSIFFQELKLELRCVSINIAEELDIVLIDVLVSLTPCLD